MDDGEAAVALRYVESKVDVLFVRLRTYHTQQAVPTSQDVVGEIQRGERLRRCKIRTAIAHEETRRELLDDWKQFGARSAQRDQDVGR
jgi:hypothetical protein